MVFSTVAKVNRVRVAVVNVLTVNVTEETKEEQPNFTISFEDDLAVLQANESNESRVVIMRVGSSNDIPVLLLNWPD